MAVVSVDVIVLVIVVLVFGTGKLKNMGKDLGGAIKGFKEGMKEGDADPKAAAEAERNKARQTIGTRKAEEEYTSFLRQLRAEAYIEIRLPGSDRAGASG